MAMEHGFETLFDSDNLPGLEDDIVMLELEQELMNGTETPLASLATFDNASLIEPQLKRMATKDTAIEMISVLQAQLRAKESELRDKNEEIERLKTGGVPKVKTEPRPISDDFEKIVEQAVAAVKCSPESEWKTGSAIEPIITEGDDASSLFDDIIRGGVVKRRLNSLDIAYVPSTKSKRQRASAKGGIVGRKIQSEPCQSLANAIASATASAKAAAAAASSSSKSRTLATTKTRQTSAATQAILKQEPIFEDDCSSKDSNNKKIARRWTPQQDEELRKAVGLHKGQNWKAIAKMVPDRDHVQCLQRWKKVLQPGLVKGMWAQEEDDLLLKLMTSSQPKNWADIAAKVPGRTAKQCRERWSLNLDPSISRAAWSQAEDELLLKLHSKLGNRWAEIKRHLTGRTENGVKTRFKSIERARAKDKEVVWTPELEAQLHEIATRFECRIDEVSKHLPRALRGISSQAMRDHCPLLKESELQAAAAAAAAR